MTTEATSNGRRPGAGPADRLGRRLARVTGGRAIPIATVVIVLIVVWYLAAIVMNAGVVMTLAGDNVKFGFTDFVAATWSQERPPLPVPHQILIEMRKTILDVAVTSKRSLVYHAEVTLSTTLLGFLIGSLTGILLAVAIVHLKALQKALMPWIIASQTVPILAVAPIVVVVLGNIGITGTLPKALISAYLCFFPVTISMVKGLTSPDPMLVDLMRTYYASPNQTFWKLRWPAAVPFLFTSLKVAVAISLVGAIVAELPTGAQAGLGARLLAGSYYGQTIQIWAALFTAAALAALLVAAVGLAEVVTVRGMGGRR
ncbi:MAG: ABC transporter permease [Ancalomicrobiaceae bacterium]|nr:ABC transporter permease [Ancalomicrobiaceae bacterium]